MNESSIIPGYVYHIKDLYFDVVKDDLLMRNHEGGAFRPTYFCLKDEKTGLLWVVPMSARIEKYRTIIEKDAARYGKCLKIMIARYGDGQSVFLFQNMFPILPKYIDHVHTVAGIPMAVNPVVQDEITKRFKEIRRLFSKGIKMVFPDIANIEKIMAAELAENTRFTIRKATKADAHDIATVLTLSWKSAYRGIMTDDFLDNLSVEKREERINSDFEQYEGKSFFFVPEYDGNIIGNLLLSECRDEDRTCAGEIISIYLLEEFWDKGYGRKMMEYAIDIFKGMGYKELVLWVTEKNDRAVRFYKKCNFTFDGTKKEMTFGEPVTIARYVLQL